MYVEKWVDVAFNNFQFHISNILVNPYTLISYQQTHIHTSLKSLLSGSSQINS